MYAQCNYISGVLVGVVSLAHAHSYYSFYSTIYRLSINDICVAQPTLCAGIRYNPSAKP